MKKYMLVIFMLGLFWAGSANAQVAVIANKSVSIASLNSNSALEIFSLNKNEYKVFYIKNSPSNDAFFGFLGKTFNDLKKVWLKAQLTEGKTATGVNSDDELLAKVASTPGAIGYISADKVNASVKVLTTIK